MNSNHYEDDTSVSFTATVVVSRDSIGWETVLHSSLPVLVPCLEHT
jgi:hypothetical protein